MNEPRPDEGMIALVTDLRQTAEQLRTRAGNEPAAHLGHAVWLLHCATQVERCAELIESGEWSHDVGASLLGTAQRIAGSTSCHR
ncbi:MAG TPA: hypothetical protein VFU07_09720 [Candidatus Lumbricidophila sp.]|nr:hypothetical protein [Candidatus Lumbricidophila sp.]